MLVVQTYTAESGVCSTCFVTALYWNKDCCIRNKETSFISYNWRATHLAISKKRRGALVSILLFFCFRKCARLKQPRKEV